MTLIEVLVVVLILSILAVVIIFAIKGNDDGAKENSCSEARDSIHLAVGCR